MKENKAAATSAMVNTAEKSTAEPIDEKTKQAVLSSFVTNGRRVEVAFSFDTTGSMYSYLTEVRTKLQESCSRLIQDIPNIRISLIAQGDYCDSLSSYAVRVLELTSDVQNLVDFARDVPSTSGGDSPECYELVLRKAQQLDWSEDSAKALVVIGDEKPHPPSYTDQQIYWRDELELLTGMGVKVYGVQAGRSVNANYFYQELADVSGGCYLTLKHLSVITDMFLAVCYNESSEEMLDNFQQEMEAAGTLTDDAQEMFSQLKQKPEKDKAVPTSSGAAKTKKIKSPKKSLNEAWWNPSLDKGRTAYRYESNDDTWHTVPVNPSSPDRSEEPSSPITLSTASASGSRRKKLKQRCTLM